MILGATSYREVISYCLKPLLRRNWGVSMQYRWTKIKEVLRGWINYYRIADMKGLMKQLDSNIRLHVRMCFWKEWKTIRNRANHLWKLGMDKYWCWRYANSRKGIYVMGRCLNRWITTDILSKAGLFNAYHHYCKVHTVVEQQMLVLWTAGRRTASPVVWEEKKIWGNKFPQIILPD